MPLTLDGTTGINLPTGSEIDISSGSLTIDVASNIILDSNSGTVQLKDNGTEYVQFFKNGNNCYDKASNTTKNKYCRIDIIKS